MDFLSAAHRVLESAGKPLRYEEITRRALEQDLISPGGSTPAATMGSRLYVDSKRADSRFERAGPATFGLRKKSAGDDIAPRVEAINQSTRRELKARLYKMPADRFEALIGELLIAIGFDETTVQVTAYTSDGGIDVRGVLNAGGVTEVNAAVQVKRWKSNVGAPTVQSVRGSLTTQERGIIITTSGFSKGAREEANAVGKAPISLVDGDQLIELLIRHSVGVNKEQHTVYSLDAEWWSEIASTEPEATPSISARAQATPSTKYPVALQALNNPALSAQLLNEKGVVLFGGKQYSSPSAAGREASGWKSCNGWRYWKYQHRETGEWRLIDDLRQCNG